MDARTITSGLSVSPQITADDLARPSPRQGFRAIICNRPDGEGMDQPTFEEIEAAAEAARARGALSADHRRQGAGRGCRGLRRGLRELPGPVLAYCRTGTRSATLWSLPSRTARCPTSSPPPRPPATT
jgi:sulfide:quinone oxidoreductase